MKCASPSWSRTAAANVDLATEERVQPLSINVPSAIVLPSVPVSRSAVPMPYDSVGTRTYSRGYRSVALLGKGRLRISVHNPGVVAGLGVEGDNGGASFHRGEVQELCPPQFPTALHTCHGWDGKEPGTDTYKHVNTGGRLRRLGVI